MFVEGASEVALEQLVIVDGLGDEAADEFEVAQMVAVDERGRVDGVGHPIGRRHPEEAVIGVEDLATHQQVPLTEEAACVLSLFIYSREGGGS